MNIRQLYRQSQPTLSFEVYPPKSADGYGPLYETILQLCDYQPGFISCTYGAGGTTRKETLTILSEVRQRHPHIGTTAHFTCVGSTVADIREFLADAQRRGIHNIMALRGDPPQGAAKFVPADGGFAYANELVGFIRNEFADFGVGVGGYPETHVEAESPEADLRYLKQKVDSGADAIYTQLFYNNDDFYRWRDQCQQAGIEVPIVPGILPILSFKQIQRITSLCGSKLPADLAQRLEAVQDNPQAQFEIGVEQAIQQCTDLIRAGVPGIHFYILNRVDAARMILDNLGMTAYQPA